MIKLFRQFLGIKEFLRFAEKGAVSSQEAFQLFTTYGFPIELIAEELGTRGIKQIDMESSSILSERGYYQVGDAPEKGTVDYENIVAIQAVTGALENGATPGVYDEATQESVREWQNYLYNEYEENGFGTRWFSVGSVQNGPDGVALVNPDYIVVQFLSYEGSFDARWGPAIGTTSVDIGVFGSGITSSDHSLQLTGSGNSYNDFSWAGPVTESRGSVNTGQTFVSVP